MVSSFNYLWSLPVYIYEEQINALFTSLHGEEKIVKGTAYGIDEFTVFHVHLDKPKHTPAGTKTPCTVIFILLLHCRVPHNI